MFVVDCNNDRVLQHSIYPTNTLNCDRQFNTFSDRLRNQCDRIYWKLKLMLAAKPSSLRLFQQQPAPPGWRLDISPGRVHSLVMLHGMPLFRQVYCWWYFCIVTNQVNVSIACVIRPTWACVATRSLPLRSKRLPPYENADAFHVLRVHLQIVQWHNANASEQKPTEMGMTSVWWSVWCKTKRLYQQICLA